MVKLQKGPCGSVGIPLEIGGREFVYFVPGSVAVRLGLLVPKVPIWQPQNGYRNDWMGY